MDISKTHKKPKLIFQVTSSLHEILIQLHPRSRDATDASDSAAVGFLNGLDLSLVGGRSGMYNIGRFGVINENVAISRG